MIPLDHLSVVDDTSVTPLMEWFGVGETFTSTGPSYGPWALAKQRRIFGWPPKNRRKWYDFARRKKRNTKGFVMEDSHADDWTPSFPGKLGVTYSLDLSGNLTWRSGKFCQVRVSDGSGILGSGSPEMLALFYGFFPSFCRGFCWVGGFSQRLTIRCCLDVSWDGSAPQY